MTKVLVTGGAGYIGSHTCVSLIEAGHEPFVLDNFHNSTPETVDRIGKITGRRPALIQADIRDRIRRGASPRHVPARIVAVADLPRTRSGKLAELAVRAVIQGEAVKNLNALANPESLEAFKDIPSLKG